MNDTIITLRGYVGGDVVLREAGDTVVASFRVGATPRLFNRATGQWADGITQWYTVSAWRQLAKNVKKSVSKGDPVIVHGRMAVKEWADKEGLARTTLEVDAESVGHDLLRGTTMFVRPPRAAEEPVGEPAAPAIEDAPPSWGVPGAQLGPRLPRGESDEATLSGEEESAPQGPVRDWDAA